MMRVKLGHALPIESESCSPRTNNYKHASLLADTHHSGISQSSANFDDPSPFAFAFCALRIIILMRSQQRPLISPIAFFYTFVQKLTKFRFLEGIFDASRVVKGARCLPSPSSSNLEALWNAFAPLTLEDAEEGVGVRVMAPPPQCIAQRANIYFPLPLQTSCEL